MTWLVLMVIIFVCAPVAKAIANRIESRDRPLHGNDGELRRGLAQAEQRLTENETRVALLEEKLDFYEKLLRNPDKKAD